MQHVCGTDHGIEKSVLKFSVLGNLLELLVLPKL